jgi:hypothetical protein
VSAPRRRLISLAVVAVAASPLVAQSAAHAAVTATPYPLGHHLVGLSTADQMVEADGALFVSSGTAGSSVEVYSTAGTHLSSITGAGASGMVVSPDGSDVYVALANSDKIIEIDASSRTQVESFTVDSCPSSLAFAAGRLFYSYGCSSGSPAAVGVSSIDPAGSTTPVQGLTNLTGDAPMIRGAGSTLVVSHANDEVSSETAGTDGSLTPIAESTGRDEGPTDMAITSDGARVAVVAGAPYNVYTYSLATMDQDLVYPGVAYPQAVAADPDGNYIAGGFESYDTTAILYGEDTSTVKWERFTATANPSTWSDGTSFDEMIPQTLTFSSDGSHVFGLVERENTTGIFLFDSTVNPQRTSTTVKVPSVGPGKSHTAIATVKGEPGATVTFTLTESGVPKSLGSATTNSKGIAKKTFAANYDGQVTASVAGGPGVLPSQRTAAFTVKSKTVARIIGPHTKRHGVRVYTSYKHFGVLFKTTPPEASRANKATIQRKVGPRWVVVARLTGYSDHIGAVVYFKTKPRAGEYRASLTVATDSMTRGSSATSKPFRFA